MRITIRYRSDYLFKYYCILPGGGILRTEVAKRSKSSDDFFVAEMQRSTLRGTELQFAAWRTLQHFWW